MAGVNFIFTILFVAVLYLGVTAHLLCYDCNAEDECVHPARHDVRTVNCENAFPDALKNNETLVCLTIYVQVFAGVEKKPGYYRGCMNVASGTEHHFCRHFQREHSTGGLVIDYCNICRRTRCVS